MKLIALMVVLATPGHACDRIAIHIGSYHTDRDLITDVNEFNPGIGCVVGNHEFGGYLNSYGDVSAYWNMTTGRDGLGVFVGLASGYSDDDFSWNGVMPQAGVQYSDDAFTVRAGPSRSAIDGEWGAIVSLSLMVGQP